MGGASYKAVTLISETFLKTKCSKYRSLFILI